MNDVAKKNNFGFVENIKNWWKSLDLTTPKIIEILSYFGIGVFIGFLFKRFGKFVLLSLLVIIIILSILASFEYIYVDWMKVKVFTGISPNDTITSIFQSYLQLIKNNIVIVVSLFIGFLIGYKIG